MNNTNNSKLDEMNDEETGQMVQFLGEIIHRTLEMHLNEEIEFFMIAKSKAPAKNNHQKGLLAMGNMDFQEVAELVSVVLGLDVTPGDITTHTVTKKEVN